jgi:Fe-S-cluster containining protein
METGYDCQRCGACCVDPFGGEGYVFLGAQEAKRMRRLGLAVVRAWDGSFLGTRARPADGGRRTCVAFRGEVGGGCGCSIYDGRPSNCQQFEVGSRECRDARRSAGLPV